ILGYTYEELKCRKPVDFVHPRSWDSIREDISRMLEGKPMVEVTKPFWIIRKNGEERFIINNYIYPRGEDDPEYLYIVFKDITEKERNRLNLLQYEEELLQSKKQYELIYDNFDDIIFLLSEHDDTNIIFKNDRAIQENLGYAPGEVKNIDEFFHPRDLDMVKKAIEKIKSGKNEGVVQENIEIRVKHKMGYFLWFLTKISPYTDESGNKLILVSRDIHDKKLKEILLEKSEKMYKNLFHSSIDAIIIHGIDGRIEDANKRALELFKYTKEEIKQLYLSDIHADGELEHLRKALKKIQEKSFIRIETRFKSKSGAIFPAEVSANLFKFEKEVFIQGIIRDITERKSNEQKLIESEKRYRLISDNSNDVILLLDKEFNLLYGNERAVIKKLGYKLDSFDSKRIKDIIHEDDYRMFLSAAGYIFQHPGSNQHREVRLIHKDGHYIWFDFDASSYKDKDAVLLLLVGREIQEKKESKLKLMESEVRYRLITENSSDLISIINEGGIIEFINENAFYAILGIGKEDLVGKRPDAIFHPDDLNSFNKMIEICLVDGRANGSFRIKNLFSNGYNWFDVIGNAFLDKDGIIKILTTARDVSERKKLEEILEKENERLREIDSMRRDFVSNATHELKTPLSSVCGASEFLDTNFDNLKQEDILKFIELIRRGSTRLKQLVNNLLDFSKIDTSRFELSKYNENIIPIIKNSIKTLQYLINTREHELLVSTPDDLYANVDKFRFEQVIINLLSNAIKNTPPRGKIEIKVDINGEYIQFSITDNGIGLTKIEMDKIFKKFGKIERKNNLFDIDIQGTGLGLYISKEIIELHGGKIWAESKGRGHGSTFYFTIPLDREATVN
ncbi:MAG: PAS domain-containing sensor histidine kinase, partial [Promethearchaeota archaeon]